MFPPMSWPATKIRSLSIAVPLSGVAQRELGGSLLAGSVVIVRRLAGAREFRRDQDVAAPSGLGGPLVDGRIGPFSGVQHHHRRIAAQRMILGRNPHGVLGGLVVVHPRRRGGEASW